MPRLSTDEREERLHLAAQKYTTGRYKITTQTPTSMRVTPRHRGWNIVADVVLFSITAGLWTIGIIFEWAIGMYSTLRLTVDPYGEVTIEGRPPLLKLAEDKTEQEGTP